MKKIKVTLKEEDFEKLDNNQMKSLCGGMGLTEISVSKTVSKGNSSNKRWDIDHIGQTR